MRTGHRRERASRAARRAGRRCRTRERRGDRGDARWSRRSIPDHDPVAAGRSRRRSSPEDVQRIRQLSARAGMAVAKVNYALSGLPRVHGHAPDAVRVAGAAGYPHRAGHRQPRARVRRRQVRRYLEAARISTSRSRRISDSSLASGAGAHVMSVYVQYTPVQSAARAYWQAARPRRGRRAGASGCSRSTRPAAKASFVAPAGDDALATSRSTYGLSGGRAAARRAVSRSALPRCARSSAGRGTGRRSRGLYLCGAGTHPGGGVTGGPGRQRRARDPARPVLIGRTGGGQIFSALHGVSARPG